jgi:hypothetical protein
LRGFIGTDKILWFWGDFSIFMLHYNVTGCLGSLELQLYYWLLLWVPRPLTWTLPSWVPAAIAIEIIPESWYIRIIVAWGKDKNSPKIHTPLNMNDHNSYSHLYKECKETNIKQQQQTCTHLIQVSRLYLSHRSRMDTIPNCPRKFPLCFELLSSFSLLSLYETSICLDTGSP